MGVCKVILSQEGVDVPEKVGCVRNLESRGEGNGANSGQERCELRGEGEIFRMNESK